MQYTVITGASSGITKAFAYKFAAKGLTFSIPFSRSLASTAITAND